MTELTRLGMWLSHLPVYLANGGLVTAYWLADNAAAWIVLACAALIALLPDTEVQLRAGYRPRRADHSDGSALQSGTPRTAQVLTALTAGLWLIAQWSMAAPVPWIGAVMWVAGLVALLALPLQRPVLLWYVKAGICIYALAVLGSRLYLEYSSQLSAAQWADLIGSSQSAAAILASTRDNVTVILLWALWLIIPLGYFSMLVQQAFINPLSLVHPLAGAQDLLRNLRVRDIDRTGI